MFLLYYANVIVCIAIVSQVSSVFPPSKRGIVKNVTLAQKKSTERSKK